MGEETDAEDDVKAISALIAALKPWITLPRMVR